MLAVDPYLPLDIESYVLMVLWLVLLAVKLWAVIDAIFQPDDSYVAADKQNKAFWMLLLVLALVLHVLIHNDPRHILNLIGTVAAFVYLADVRPTLRAMRRR